ncbi:sugar phosphate isomerase/epimerase [Granulicella sp. S190]|uniref:sugar phosphate isomerase/epimerase family protein n=1 Tax=Granulicella sp. S190 TaxID=1747226 RepID=UPI00131B6742|nr:sugar phosphate isomerase/epimerase [Granulicella sp. S190]
MRLGLFTPIFNGLTLDALLVQLKKYPQIEALEIGTGGWPGNSHLDLDALLASKEAARAYRLKLEDAGLSISALSCHGNPVHPKKEIAERDDEVLRKTVKLAEQINVPVVVTFSGCPGGSAQDVTPNWITAAWPPEFSDALAWQWEERLIPYWKDAAQFAKDAGVKVALEAHPGFCVYNPETVLKLREAVGSSVGINLDPSHLWWQGIDIPAAIAALGEAIFHFHAKDVAIHSAMRDVNGVLDTKSYREMAKRSWLFRSVGWGHGELEWKRIASALRLVGYDYVMSIEHEDALASTHEGLSSAIGMLSRVLLKEAPVEAWWA